MPEGSGRKAENVSDTLITSTTHTLRPGAFIGHRVHRAADADEAAIAVIGLNDDNPYGDDTGLGVAVCPTRITTRSAIVLRELAEVVQQAADELDEANRAAERARVAEIRQPADRVAGDAA